MRKVARAIAAMGVMFLVACGPEVFKPDPVNNSAQCPQEVVVDGSACPSKGLVCYYISNQTRPCGGGTSDTFTYICSEPSPDAGTTWAFWPCY